MSVEVEIAVLKVRVKELEQKIKDLRAWAQLQTAKIFDKLEKKINRMNGNEKKSSWSLFRLGSN